MPPGTTSGEDRSTNPTVVEYAAIEMRKGKSPLAAANRTAKKLSGGENMFLGPGVTVIDPKKLEGALWDRMAEDAAKGLVHFREGKEHYVLGGTLQFYKQAPFGGASKPAARSKLKALVIEKLGRDPFLSDDGS
jgi:hypothetical protein